MSFPTHNKGGRVQLPPDLSSCTCGGTSGGGLCHGPPNPPPARDDGPLQETLLRGSTPTVVLPPPSCSDGPSRSRPDEAPRPDPLWFHEVRPRGVEDPRLWLSGVISAMQALGALAARLTSALEDPRMDLEAPRLRRLWRQLDTYVALDLHHAVHTLAPIADRLRTLPTTCCECSEPSSGPCALCSRGLCGDHRTLTMTHDGATGLCPSCADDMRAMFEEQGHQEGLR